MRGYTASFLIGTDIFVKKLIGDGCKKYYISPSLKAGPIHREFCIIQGLATQVTENLSREIMEDDRVARRPQHYKDTFADGLKELEAYSDYVWSRLAPIAHTGIQACDMRTKCCTSAQIAGGYIDGHLWREVDSHACRAPDGGGS